MKQQEFLKKHKPQTFTDFDEYVVSRVMLGFGKQEIVKELWEEVRRLDKIIKSQEDDCK